MIRFFGYLQIGTLFNVIFYVLIIFLWYFQLSNRFVNILKVSYMYLIFTICVLGNFIHIFVCTKLVHPEYLKFKHQLTKDFNVSLDLALVKDYHRRPYPLPLGYFPLTMQIVLMIRMYLLGLLLTSLRNSYSDDVCHYLAHFLRH